MVIRRAVREDLPALLDIYNYEVEHGVATFDLHPRTLDQWSVWFDVHNRDNHPLLAAELDGHVAGYASLSAYRDKEAYQGTVELSVYVSPDDRGKGVATALMEAILREAREDERTHTVVSVITASNAASVRLHERFGFEYCGRIREVGLKFGRYLDIDNYRLSVSNDLRGKDAWPEGYWDIYGALTDETFTVPEDYPMSPDDIPPFDQTSIRS